MLIWLHLRSATKSQGTPNFYKDAAPLKWSSFVQALPYNPSWSRYFAFHFIRCIISLSQDKAIHRRQEVIVGGQQDWKRKV